MSDKAVRYPRVKGAWLYRGLVVGPGTALHEALSAKNPTLSNALYDEQKKQFEKTYGEGSWDRC